VEHPFSVGKAFPIFSRSNQFVPKLTNIQAALGISNLSKTFSYSSFVDSTDVADAEGYDTSFLITSVNSGILYINGNPVIPSKTIFDYSDSLTWTPPQNASGILDAFTLRAWDGQNLSETDVPVQVNLVDPAEWNGGLLEITGGDLEGNVRCGGVPVGQASNPYSLSFTNYGSQTLEITNVAISGENPGDFHITVKNDRGDIILEQPDPTSQSGAASAGNVGLSIPVGATYTIDFVFVPQGSDLRSMRIAFTTNDPRDGGQARILNVDGVGMPWNPPTLTTIDTLTGAKPNLPFEITYSMLSDASDISDPDPEPRLSFRIERIVSGTLTMNGEPVVPGETEIGLGQSVLWTPASDIFGHCVAFLVRASDESGLLSNADVSVAVDLASNRAITATIEQTAGQADPTNGSIRFTVVFSNPVVDFTPDDVSLAGTATGTIAATIKPLGSDSTTYEVSVNGMTGSGTVVASIAAGVVHDAAGNSNVASTSDDNQVLYFPSEIIRGTTGSDVFEFFVGNGGPADWTLNINGIKQNISFGAAGVLLDGQRGNDQVWFYGNSSALTADLWYERGWIHFGSYTLGYANMDYVAVVGASGNDHATLHDSAGNDAFLGLFDSAQLTTNGKAITAKNFNSVSVQGTTGNDTAVMYDRPTSNSIYAAGPSGVNFIGGGFNYHVAGFKTVSAYAAPGRNNYAYIDSTDGHDILIASYLGAQYIGEGFAYDVWNLRSIEGLGGVGDEARFYGSPGGDTTLNLSPTEAIQIERYLTLKGFGYRQFSSYVYPDGNTSATITGSAGDDRAVTSPLGTQLFSTDLALSAWTYRHINVVGNGGTDTADMYTSSGADAFWGNGATAMLTSNGVDRTANYFSQITAHGNIASSASFFAKAGMTNTFNATPTQASMSGDSYKSVAMGFGSNSGYAVPGGTDAVNYSDSIGDDYFISSYMGSQMFGKGFNNSAWNFATMNAQSTGGADTSRFYGSPTSADRFVATPTDAQHTGKGFQSEAKNFARVEAYSGTGGTAQLTGSSGDDQYVGSPLGAQLWGNGYRVEAWNYASVKAESNGGDDLAYLFGNTANNKLAADCIFAEFSGDRFINRVDNFATVRVQGSTTGSDTAALDHAYLETGMKDQPSTATDHTIKRKLWLYEFDQITTTEKPLKPSPQSIEVDRFMTAFMYE
jgi:hypothetical protein